MYEKLKNEMKKQGKTGNQLAMESRIASADFYSAINGKKTMFPAWKKRISEVLGMPEADLFDDEE